MPIPVYVRADLRTAFASVPGARLLDSPPDVRVETAGVVDEKVARKVLETRPSYLLIVAMRKRDHHAEVSWIERGADDCVVVDADLAASLPRIVALARARQSVQRRKSGQDQRYRFMVEHMLDVMTLIDGMGEIRYQSPSIKPVLGYDPSELVGRNAMQFVHPNDVPRLLQILADGRGTPGAEATAAYRWKHGDGSWRHVESTAVNLLFEPGIESVIVVTRDVTEKTQAQESLRASRSRMAALLAALPDAYVLVDAHGIYQDVHIPADYAAVGDAKALIGKHVNEVLPEEVARKCMNAIDSALATGEQQVFDYSVVLDGKARYREARVVQFTDETVLSIQRDITERINSIEALRQSEWRFRELFEASPDAIFLESTDGYVVDANPAAAALHEADREWLIGRHVSELVPGKYRDLVKRDFDKLVDGSIRRGEGHSQTKTGRIIPIEFSVGFTTHGKSPAVVLHVRDISERRRSEELVRRLMRVRRTAVEKERARISREVHDRLGQALTSLRFDVARVSRKAPNDLEPEFEAAAARIDAIIDDVRRISSDLRPGILDDLGLGPALEWEAQRFGERTGIAVHLDLPVDLHGIDPDLSIALFRIFQELATNVARHAQADSMHVTLESDDSRIRLVVEDDGVGVSGNPLESHDSLGLMGIRERLEPFDGVVNLEPASPKGTSAIVIVPNL